MRLPLYTLIFALSAVALRAQDCAPAAALLPNDTQSGTLDQTSCQLSDGTRYADYMVMFPVRGNLTLTAKGATGLVPSVIIRNASGNRVNPATAATVAQYMESGTYHVLVNSGNPAQAGTFTLASVFTPETGVLCTESRNLGTVQPVSGRFTATSCKLPDGSNCDSWQVTVYGAGTLTLSLSSPDFATYLILRGPDGTALAFDPSSISVSLPGSETYTVIAAAADASQKPGAYQLAASFAPVDGETCVAQGGFQSGLPVSGSVSGGSCNFDLPGREDSSLFNFYDFRVTAAGQAQLQVTSSSFNPLLLLLDANGNEVTEDSQSGGSGMPMIQQQLAPGAYRLLIFNEDSFDGQYTIQYNFAPGSATPCPVQSLAAGSQMAGALSSPSSCRVTGSLSDVYQVVLPRPGTFAINMSSSDFTTFLILRDAKDNLIGYGEQTPDGSSSNSSVSLPAGTYFIVASSADLPGNYQIAYQFNSAPVPACPAPVNLPLNTGFVGALGPGSCTGTDGQFVDSYQFTTAADGTVAAVLQSAVVPGLLTLTDAKNNELRTDAGGYSEDSSIVVQYLKAGTYRLQTRSDEYNITGAYRVTLLYTASATKPQGCSASALQIGTPKTTALSYTSCNYYDGTFADEYKFTITNAAKPVNILGVSTSFDAFLILTDAKGNIIALDDNSGGGLNAQITGALATGTYYVSMKPSSDPSSSGAYTITVKQ